MRRTDRVHVDRNNVEIGNRAGTRQSSSEKSAFYVVPLVACSNATPKTLLASETPIVLTGDYNVIPTDLDIYTPGRWIGDALFRPEVRDAYRRLVEQDWTSAECWAHSVD